MISLEAISARDEKTLQAAGIHTPARNGPRRSRGHLDRWERLRAERRRRHLHHPRKERDQLAVRTLLHANPRFREKVLLTGTWRPDGGASPRTFFLNHTRYSFQGGLREWQKARKQDQVALFQAAEAA
jgi:hypothetical protein